MVKTLHIKIEIDENYSPSQYHSLRMSGTPGAGVNLATISQTITGDNDQSLTFTKLTTSYTQLNAVDIAGTTLGGKACHWYIKNAQPAMNFGNTDQTNVSSQGTITDVIIADDGDQIIARLAPGEFMYFISGDNTKIQAKAAEGTVGCEYMCFHMA